VETLNATGWSNVIQYNWKNTGRDVLFRIATDGETWGGWERLYSSSVSIYAYSEQTIASNTNTTIEFERVDFDSDNLADLSGNRIVLKTGGIWLVVASVTYNEDGQDGDYRGARIIYEGYRLTHTLIPPTAAWTTVVSVSLVRATSGGVLSLQGRHNAGGDRMTKDGPDNVFLEATYMGQG
jgi:hypothetical protein